MSIMNYVSPILHQLKAAHEIGDPDTHSKGRTGREWGARPYGSLKGSSPLSIPRMEVRDILELIKEKDAKNAWLTTLCDRVGSKVKNQQQTNYCWINAVIRAIEVRRAAMGLPYVELSPASVGAIIKNYRNVGGWGGEGLEYCCSDGVAPADLWPCNAIDRRYDNAASQAARKRFIVDQWAEFEAGDDQMVWTAIVNDIATALGIPAWSHEVCGTRLAANRGSIIVVIDNSWGTDWGDNGRGTLTGSYARFDDACAPITAGAAAA